MTKKELDNFFKDLERIEHAKYILPNLKIEWETDIDKMDFLALRSYKLIPKLIDDHNKEFKSLSIEIIELDKYDSGGLFTSYPGALQFLNLIDLVESNIKIIPPTFDRPMQMVNGELNTMGELSRTDGSHRIILSRIMGLTKIPGVVIETINKFTFSKSEWQFDYDDNNINVRNINNDKKFNFVLSDWKIGLSSQGDIIIDRN